MKSDFIKLEYNNILSTLASYCKTYIGKNLAENLLPSSKKTEVEKLLSETTEAYNLINQNGSLPMDFLPNIELWIKYLESSQSLSAKSLLDIGKTLNLSSKLKKYFFNDEIKASNYPILEELFSSLYTNSKLEIAILNNIIDENNIADNASKKLYSLRKNRRNLEQEIKDKLNSMIHSSTYSKYIMEPIVTIRNNRYVIPVKIEEKDKIKGFIHDISASGSTVFIEPTTIFELNSKINDLKLEENLEIEIILENLSSMCMPITSNLKELIQTIGKIDFIFAKASYSKTINGIKPRINEEKFLSFIEARHPLIDPEKVVPIDITLGKNFKSLIITGPNTGGKTVTLKTVGLLSLMACSGLHIPANEKSSIYVFSNIFADIGDSQSIQESLSTFSSHMINIINILHSADENSLILVDELGSGTDPTQGASLAISILEYIYNLGATTLATTHYSEIKNYALITDGFENASCEFDIEKLEPTYHLLVGVPGKSNAFAISKRLGLPNEILNRANSLLTDDHIQIEELLKSIYDNKQEIEKEKEKIKKNSNQIETLRKNLEKEFSISEQNEKKILEKAKLEARNILLTAKEEANEILKKMNNLADTKSSASLKEANILRNKLNTSIKNTILQAEKETTSNLTIENISVGMNALFKPLNSTCTILTLPNKSKDMQIQIGSAKMTTNIKNLEKIKTQSSTLPNQNTSSIKKNFNLKAKTISTEINVIGMNVEEAIFTIDKYLDDCAIANISPVRIIHGKGTGKLRKGIHSFLKTNKHVKTFRTGTFGEGEMGVTIVETY